MKKPLIIMVLCCFPAIAFTVPAEARPGGCIKGALMACIGGTNTIGNGRRLAAPLRAKWTSGPTEAMTKPAEADVELPATSLATK